MTFTILDPENDNHKPIIHNFQMRLILYYFDLGLFARLPSDDRPSSKFPALLEALGLAAADLPGLPLDHSDLGFYDELRNGQAWFQTAVLGTKTTVLCDPALVAKALASSPHPLAPSELMIASMNKFQPRGLATTPAGGDFGRRRSANLHALQTGRRAHQSAAAQLSYVQDAVDGIQTANGSLGWGQIDRAARVVAAGVVFGKNDVSFVNDLGKFMLMANLVPLLGVVRPRVSRQQFVDLLDRAHEPVLSRVVATVSDDGSELAQLQERIGAQHPVVDSLFLHLSRCRGLHPSEIPDQVTHWLFAARGTLAVHTAYTLALLARHRREQDRIHRELSAFIDDKAFLDALSAGTDAQSLRTLEGAVAEAARLFPAVPLTLREIAQDLVMDRDLTLEKGELVLIHNVANHRDRRFSGNGPDRFVPDRWSARSGSDIPLRTNGPTPYIFGGGDKECPGRNVGLLLIKATVGLLLRRYRVTDVENLTPDQAPLNADRIPVTYDQFGINLSVTPLGVAR